MPCVACVDWSTVSLRPTWLDGPTLIVNLLTSHEKPNTFSFTLDILRLVGNLSRVEHFFDRLMGSNT